MRSAVFRRAFADHGIEAGGPIGDRARAAIIGLIAELQRGERESAGETLGSTAKGSFEEQFAGRPVVCLACTELPLAFPERKTLPVFEVDGVVYVNASAIHIGAALVFAQGGLNPPSS
jgi:aspartate racemase